jgi:phosphatidate cytidylyltransferase
MTDHLAPNQPAAKFARPPTNELLKRFVSAVVLGAIGIFATVTGVWPLAIIVSAVSGVLAWEWGRLVRNQQFDDTLILHVAALLFAIGFATAGMMRLALLALLIGAVVIAIRRSKEYNKLSAIGVPYVGIAAIGIIWLRSSEQGLAAVLLIFACVWAHDSVAMFAGRAAGGPRLWPSVSPKKTWSGAIAGLLASTITAALAVFLIPEANVVWLAVLGLIFGVAALLGDLAESSLKRLGRVKNASGLIPGHGGFLDRLDGAVASFSVACLIALYLNAEMPARALLRAF